MHASFGNYSAKSYLTRPGDTTAQIGQTIAGAVRDLPGAFQQQAAWDREASLRDANEQQKKQLYDAYAAFLQKEGVSIEDLPKPPDNISVDDYLNKYLDPWSKRKFPDPMSERVMANNAQSYLSQRQEPQQGQGGQPAAQPQTLGGAAGTVPLSVQASDNGATGATESASPKPVQNSKFADDYRFRESDDPVEADDQRARRSKGLADRTEIQKLWEESGYLDGPYADQLEIMGLGASNYNRLKKENSEYAEYEADWRARKEAENTPPANDNPLPVAPAQAVPSAEPASPPPPPPSPAMGGPQMQPAPQLSVGPNAPPAGGASPQPAGPTVAPTIAAGAVPISATTTPEGYPIRAAHLSKDRDKTIQVINDKIASNERRIAQLRWEAEHDPARVTGMTTPKQKERMSEIDKLEDRNVTLQMQLDKYGEQEYVKTEKAENPLDDEVKKSQIRKNDRWRPASKGNSDKEVDSKLIPRLDKTGQQIVRAGEKRDSFRKDLAAARKGLVDATEKVAKAEAAHEGEEKLKGLREELTKYEKTVADLENSYRASDSEQKGALRDRFRTFIALSKLKKPTRAEQAVLEAEGLAIMDEAEGLGRKIAKHEMSKDRRGRKPTESEIKGDLKYISNKYALSTSPELLNAVETGYRKALGNTAPATGSKQVLGSMF